MEYYVNIAKNGRFFCRVEFGETMTGEADARAAKVRELFKADEGFNCTLHARETAIHLCKESFGEAWK